MADDAASRDQENKRREAVRRVFAQLFSDESFFKRLADRIQNLKESPFLAGEGMDKRDGNQAISGAPGLSRQQACERTDKSDYTLLIFYGLIFLAAAITIFIKRNFPRWNALAEPQLQTARVWTLESIGDFFTSFVAPHNVPWFVVLEAFLFLAAVGFVGYGVLRWRNPPPKHEPDPLFDRMLKERFPLPVSKYTYTDILCDPRFLGVLAEALDTVFPFSLTGDKDEQGKFIERLIEHLGPNGRCARFLLGHSVDVLKKKDLELSRYLDEEMREMVFTEILDDPAFLYLYKRNQPRWRQVLAWFSAIDYERAIRLFRSGESKKEKPDKMQLALVGLVLVLITLLAGGAYGKKECSECKQSSTLSLSHSQQLDELTTAIKALVAKLSPEGRANTGGSPVVVNVLPAAAPSVTVPISMPGFSEPPKTNVSVQVPRTVPDGEPAPHAGDVSQLSGSESQTTGETKLAGGAISIINQNSSASSDPRTISSKLEATVGGDDFVTMVYQRESKYATAPASLVLHTASGAPCTFTVAAADSTQWPPDPLTIKVLAADAKNAAECRTAKPDGETAWPGKGNTFSATEIPSYSSLLHAYVSVAAYHRHHLPPFRKKLFVLRMHYEAVPKN